MDGEEENKFPCKVCGKSFKSKKSLARHLRVHPGQVCQNQLPCKICGKLFKGQYSLDIHQVKHTGEKNFECDECGVKFGTKGNMVAHMKIHTGVKLYDCPVCGKFFRKSFDMKRHAALHTRKDTRSDLHVVKPTTNSVKHTREKKFECNQCGVRFTQNKNMTDHMSIHTGVKPHKCSVCGRSFRRKPDVKKHVNAVHTRKDPHAIRKKNFECDECGTKFGTKGSMVDHMSIHTGVKPNKCSVCGKSFRKKSDLKRHFILHTREGKYPCEDCGERFQWKKNLVAHMREVHKNAKKFKPTAQVTACKHVAVKKENTKPPQINNLPSQKKSVSPLKCVVCRSEPGFKSSFVDQFKPQNMGMRFMCPKCDIILEGENNLEEYFRKASILLYNG